MTGEATRRLNPRLIDTDWLVLRKLKATIAGYAADLARPEMVTVDFGCGSAPYRSIFERLGARYRGADFAGADIVISDAGIVDAVDGSADLLLSIQVLEHVRDLSTYLNEARRVLAADGWMILSTHGTWFYHPHPEDHRRWTRTGLIAELEGHGFEVKTTVPILGPLAWTTIIRLVCGHQVARRIPVLGPSLAAALAILMNLRAMLEERITPAWVTNDNACIYAMLCRPSRPPQ